jgi:hypothetical protein
MVNKTLSLDMGKSRVYKCINKYTIFDPRP